MAAEWVGYCQRPVCCLCGWQEIKAVCDHEWVLCQKKKVMRKLTGRLLIACFFFCVSTGQHTEEGHCSADPGEERAAGGASSEERWY